MTILIKIQEKKENQTKFEKFKKCDCYIAKLKRKEKKNIVASNSSKRLRNFFKRIECIKICGGKHNCKKLESIHCGRDQIFFYYPHSKSTHASTAAAAAAATIILTAISIAILKKIYLYIFIEIIIGLENVEFIQLEQQHQRAKRIACGCVHIRRKKSIKQS